MENIRIQNAEVVPNPPQPLWIDHPDALQHIEKMLQAGLISEQEAVWLSGFHRDGFVIFPHAFSSEETALVRNELRTIYREPEKYLLRMPKGEVIHPDEPFCPPKSRLLDYYVNSKLARDMVLAPIVTRFLKLVYNEPPLAFQSLLFTWGTEHSIHSDNTYIVAHPQCTLTASWIALEDVVPGAGELVYYPGSHRHPLFLFKGERIEWQHQVDGKLAHLEYTRFLRERADEGCSKQESFFAKEGDLLIWHSNLVHYGTDIVVPDQTRQSILTHYCPADSGTPNYFRFFKDARKKNWGEGFYSSRRYQLCDGEDNPYPVYKK